MIYLDNCATTRPLKSVIDAMTTALQEDFSNPSSLHQFGYAVSKKKEAIRESIKDYFNCRSGELYFTSGGTESNNTAIRSAIENKGAGKNVVTTNIEHPSILNVIKASEMELRQVAIDETGHIAFEKLMDAIDEDTVLVSLFHVNNELGSINPVEEWVPKIKATYPTVKVHVDGVQAVGKLPVDFDAMGCDTYSFSGHKFHGPKGIGGLLVKKSVKPFIYGGGQEMGMRSGTENIPGIYGLGAAFDALKEEGIALEAAETRMDHLRAAIETIDAISINTTAPASPYILNVSLADTRGEVLLHMLEEKEVYISTSSACSSHRTGKNPVLTALGLSDNFSEGTIRLCLSRETTLEECDEFVVALKEAVETIRSIMRR